MSSSRCSLHRPRPGSLPHTSTSTSQYTFSSSLLGVVPHFAPTLHSDRTRKRRHEPTRTKTRTTTRTKTRTDTNDDTNDDTNEDTNDTYKNTKPRNILESPNIQSENPCPTHFSACHVMCALARRAAPLDTPVFTFYLQAHHRVASHLLKDLPRPLYRQHHLLHTTRSATQTRYTLQRHATTTHYTLHTTHASTRPPRRK